MKKLMVAIAAAATAFGLYAANDPGFKSGTGFDAMTAGVKTLTELNTDDGNAWSSTDAGAAMEVKAYASGEALAEDYRPAEYSNHLTQYNYLNVKTALDKPLARTMEATSLASADFYVDTLVKFTACDEEITTLGDDAAKIAVWVKENEEAGTTNLMITAGYISASDGSVVATNYNCGSFTTVDAWHRLTIKAIGDISNVGLVGFVVFIDGNLVEDALVCDDDKGYDGYKTILNDVATLWDNKGQLFPSLKGTADGSISALAVAGQGAIDDIAFTATAPDWANKAAATITWNTETVAWVSIDGGTTQLTTGSLVVEAGKAVTITAEAAEGYMITSGTGDWTPAAGATKAVEAAAVAATVEIDGVTTKCASLEDAIELVEGASTDAVLTLGGDSGAIVIDRSLATDSIIVTIDLAGNTITPEEGAEWGILVDGAAVVVTDNSESVGTVNSGTSGSVASTLDAVLAAGIFKGMTGMVSGVVNGVKCDKDAKDSIDCLDDDQQWSDADADALYTVIEKLPEPFTVTVPVLTTGLTIQSLMTNGVEVVPPVAGDYTLNEGEAFSMTYAPDSGYKFTDEKETGVRAASETTEIDPPTVELIMYTVTWDDSAANATAVATVDDAQIESGDEVAPGKDVVFTVTPNQDYEYASAPDGWVKSGDSITRTFTVQDEDLTVVIPVATEKSTWPADWPADADDAVKAKFAAWIAGPGAGTTTFAGNEAAFLLNVAPGAEKALTIEEINVVPGGAGITVSLGGDSLAGINGVLFVNAGDTLDSMTDVPVAAWDDVEGKKHAVINAKFVKAVIGFKAPVAKPE